MADYTDIGFDQFLQRSNPPGVVESGNSQTNPMMTDYQMQSISGNKIGGGVMNSANGRMIIDLNNGVFKINNGNADLVTMGTLPDGSIGLLIKDNDGNILLEVAGDKTILSSSNDAMQIDLQNENIIMYDDAHIPQFLLGRNPNG